MTITSIIIVENLNHKLRMGYLSLVDNNNILSPYSYSPVLLLSNPKTFQKLYPAIHFYSSRQASPIQV
ncbi:hypothetical protein, partial [Chryseobacterium sp.]|uniref:hypothetical protein n=1 Tax=Chryseobacterium sp. TaxID=1871047 RepID=UPI002FC5F1E2